MIHYKRGGKWHLINLFIMRGSLFPAAFAMAGPCALITFLLKWYNVFSDDDVLTSATAWSGFSSLVGFLVVFRTSEAYSRFWDGCSATHQMRAEWEDAASAMMAFCKHSSAPEEEVLKFKHLAVRLFSLLHAMALGEIEECGDLDGVMAFDLELIDPCGLDKESWRTLKTCHNKVTLVFTWLQTLIVENLKSGVLSIPPPILSRVYQELANGMVALHEAEKIANIPFPFPYAQTCDALLFLHWFITPVVTSSWAAEPWAAAVFGFVQVFILWALNNIAVEIEHPFGNDANDLDASQMQLDMNMCLLLMLHPAATRAPQLTPGAKMDGLVSMGRRASQRMSTLQTTYNDVIGGDDQDFWNSEPAHCVNVASLGSAASRESNASSAWAKESLQLEEPEGDVLTSKWAKDQPVAVADRAPTGRIADPTFHMEPVCSLPISQAQQGDTMPDSEVATPTASSCGSRTL